VEARPGAAEGEITCSDSLRIARRRKRPKGTLRKRGVPSMPARFVTNAPSPRVVTTISGRSASS